MAFSLSILLPTGERFEAFTTSDSWRFYRLADDIAKTDGMVEHDNLSHAPTGLGVGIGDQLQPLIAAMVYKGLHSADSRVTIEEVARYLPCIFFISMLIPVFLIGREFAGDVGGCAAALFLAMMMSAGTTSPLYWSKVGGFDREVLQQVMAAWIAYFMISVLKNPRPQPAIAGGLVYGLFAVLWLGGAAYLIPIALLAVVLVVLNEALTRGKLRWNLNSIGGAIWGGLRASVEPILALAIVLAVGGLLGWFLTGFAFSTGLMITIFSIGLLVLIPLYRRYRMEALWLVVPGVVVIGLLTLPYWLGLAVQVLEMVGLKAPAVEFPRYASEAQRPNWGDQLVQFYGGFERLSLGWFITVGAFASFFLALGVMLLTRKRHELFLYAWFFGLILLAADQVRFFRQWWPMLAAVVGIGFVMVLKWSWKALGEPTLSSSTLGDALRKPLIIAICVFFLSAAFVQNARAQVELTGPPEGEYTHEALVDVSEWMKANTPENSVVAVQWSFGHSITAWAKRPTVVDGLEIAAEEGEWEDTGILPDYIYRVIDGKAVFLGDLRDPLFYENTPPHPWGRRDDVDWLMVEGDGDNFRSLASLYKDNYGVDINYIIFTRFDYVRAGFYSLKRPGEVTSSYSGTLGQPITYHFAAESVTLDMTKWVAASDGTYLAGVIAVGVWPGGGRWILTQRYLPAGASKILWVEFDLGVDEQGQIVLTGVGEAGLVGVPMVVRAFQGYALPAYLREVYRAQNQGAIVYEILL